MATTKTQIMVNAISLLGKGPVATIAAAGNFAAFVENMYDMAIGSVIAKGSWRFATALMELSKAVDEPIIDQYEYIYQLPADYLANVRLHPATFNYNIFQNKLLYANASKIILEYRFKPDESRFPAYFVEFFTNYLAAYLALTGGITGDVLVKLETKAQGLLVQALAADACSHPTQAIVSSPYITVRGV